MFMEKKEKYFLSPAFKHFNNTDGYETPLNKSVNFFLFSPEYPEFQYLFARAFGDLYLEVCLDVDETTREVKRIKFNPVAKCEWYSKMLREEIENIADWTEWQTFDEETFIVDWLKGVIGNHAFYKYFINHPISFNNLTRDIDDFTPYKDGNRIDIGDLFTITIDEESGIPVFSYMDSDEGAVLKCQLIDIRTLLERNANGSRVGTWEKINKK